jgi:hypothetical protein
MNRRQKRLARVPGDNKMAERPPVSVREMSKHEYICEGCDRVSETKECKVYAMVPPYYLRQGCCYFNRPTTTKKKGRVRVGQQKQRSFQG